MIDLQQYNERRRENLRAHRNRCPEGPRNTMRWTGAETSRAIEMVEGGCTLAQIADELGRTRQAVSSQLRTVKYKRPERRPEWTKLLESVILDESLSHAQAAEVLGLTRTSVKGLRLSRGIRRCERPACLSRGTK